VYSGSTLDQYNTIQNNVMLGGYYGIYWSGVSTASYELGNVFNGNDVRDFYMYGMYSYYQDAIKINKNNFRIASTAGTAYGLYTGYNRNNIEFTRNNIYLTGTSTIYGLYMTNDIGTTTLRGNVSNNMIATGGTSTGTVYGIYLATTSYQDLSYNSVRIGNNSTSSRALFLTGGTASTVNVRNNNLTNFGGGYAIYTGSATGALATSNYNNLYTSGANVGYWTANTATLAAWRTSSSRDANSVSMNPDYFGTADLHVNTPAFNNLGTPVSGLTDDIDGQTRDASTPDIGADEFSLVYNDAGINAMTAPANPCAGVNDIYVRIKNYGISQLTSVVVNWSVNGVTQTPASITSLTLNKNQESSVFIGSYTFASGQTYTLRFWTNSPNGITDSNTMNDLLLLPNITTVFSGTYTIGPSGNYTTFNAAVVALAAKGVCGPVKFNVSPGTYTERVVIPAIPGASATNTVTFEGAGISQTTLTFAGTSTTSRTTILFNGADFITFKKMTIQNTGTLYGAAAQFIGAADYNTIDSCYLLVDTNATSSGVCITSASGSEASFTTTGNSANYTTISNCILKGGYYGVMFYGTSTSTKCTNNSVINCTMTKVYYYGFYLYYQTYPSVINSSVDLFRNTSTNYGIYNYYGGTQPRFIGNRIITKYYGLYNYYCDASRIERNFIVGGYMALYLYRETNSTDSTLITNNMIRQGGNASYPYGYSMYFYYVTKGRIYNNTVQTDSTYSSPTSYGVRVYYCNNMRIQNNIFRSKGNMPCIATDGAGLAKGDLDYNIYWTTPGNIIAYWGTTSYTSFGVWQSSLPNFNKNSYYLDPQLVSYYDFHLKPTAPFYRGTKVNVALDFDGQSRCTPAPTIGADEYVHPYSKPVADFYCDSVICKNSPYTFVNKADYTLPQIYRWFVNENYMATSFHYSHKFTESGLDTVSLVVQNCSATDTLTKIIKVDTSFAPPQSYFISNKNLIEINEEIEFLDISSACPEKWIWGIYPDSINDPMLGYRTPTYAVTYGTINSQFPKVVFLYSGKYTICLTTINSVDTGITYCINDYIEVKPSAVLCVYPFDSKEQYGTLYDEGGYNGQYLNSKTCYYSIHPCTDEVRLVFRMFDVASGDYMRIFDGPTNKSKPLWNILLYPQGFNNSNFVPSLADTFIATSGTMYIELATDASTQANGFIANWNSIKGTYIQPIANFVVEDTVCNGVPTVFKNTSIGDQNDNYWDFENDNYTDATTVDGVNKYVFDGPYAVRLIVSGCGGSDTIVDSIYVQTAMFPPQFELIANNHKPNIFSEVVTISENTLLNCVDSVAWQITPNTYLIISGKLANSHQLQLKFNDTVCYDFMAIGKYLGMSDTVYYPCFIKPLLYCNPVASNLNPDIGISRFALNEIDNYSDIGVTEFSDYTGTASTELEIGARYDVTVERLTNFNPISHKIWIDFNLDGAYDDNTELVAYSSTSKAKVWKGILSLPLGLDQITTRMRVGVSLAGTSFSPCGPNYFGEFEEYKVSFIPDKTKPVLSMLGADMLHLVECSPSFVDPGVLAFDNVDTNMIDSVKITGTVDPKTPGTYQIRYNVKDAAGNVADELVRTVIVDPETTAPEITLLGKLVDTIVVFNSYTDPGYQAYDTCSGLDKVVVTSTLDTTKLGAYKITYQAFDIAGNSAQDDRTIHVIDNVAPDISSTTNDTIVVNVYQLLPNPLFIVTDNYYTDVDVKITGTYYDNFPNGEATALGFYTFKYTATDGSGNQDMIDFVIQVVDGVKPVLQLKGFFYYRLCRFDTLIDPGVVVSDNYDKNIAVVKSGTYITDYLPNRRVGSYDLVYTATDNSGNSSSDLRYIDVSDKDDCYSLIGEGELNAGIGIFPTIGDGRFNLVFNNKSDQNVRITVLDALGNIISQTDELIKPGDIKSFNYNDQKQGMYFIRVNDNNSITSFKYNLVK
jgi:PKD repeat protein